MTQICLRVSGIVCDGCRTLVEAALRDAEKDGARSTFQWSECEGFPDTGDVLLHSEASTDDLIAAVKATGRECATVEPAVWRTTRLKVGGMTCGHCSGRCRGAVVATAAARPRRISPQKKRRMDPALKEKKCIFDVFKKS